MLLLLFFRHLELDPPPSSHLPSLPKPRLLSAPLLKFNFWWFNGKPTSWQKVKVLTSRPCAKATQPPSLPTVAPLGLGDLGLHRGLAHLDEAALRWRIAGIARERDACWGGSAFFVLFCFLVSSPPGARPRSSNRAVRIRVPTFFWTSILVGEPSPKKRVKGHYWGPRDLAQTSTLDPFFCWAVSPSSSKPKKWGARKTALPAVSDSVAAFASKTSAI